MKADRKIPILEDHECSKLARELVSLSENSANNQFNDVTRCLIAFKILLATVKAQSVLNPMDFFKLNLQECVEAFAGLQYNHNDSDSISESIVESLETQNLYGDLFSALNDSEYFDQPMFLLDQRLSRNHFPIEKFPSWSALDSGCGNGRYTVALKNLGMKTVTGIDFSPMNISNANSRIKGKSNLGGVSFVLGDCLDLPFDNEEFDFCFSNGVLHHTSNPEKGVSELLRVLKRGGVGFFKVMPNPGGLHWDSIELCRILVELIPHQMIVQSAKLLNMSASQRYFFIDHIKVPINKRFTKEQVWDMLTRNGAKNVRFCERGADLDRTEKCYFGGTREKVLFGLGESRWYFEK